LYLHAGCDRYPEAGLSERTFAYPVLHHEEDKTALGVPWQFSTYEGWVHFFEERGAAIRPRLTELLDTYPACEYCYVDEGEEVKKTEEEDEDENDKENVDPAGAQENAK
jgi:hypothetical protein